MAALAKLRAPVDAFFDKVLVNDPDPTLRANRLRLLNRIREATRAVADFSKIAGRDGLFALAARGNPIWSRGLLSHRRDGLFALASQGAQRPRRLGRKGEEM